MHPAALVFLEDQRARRLAVAWQACKGDERTWLETAGFAGDISGIKAVMTMLLRNEICRPGGVTDELALKYITSLATAPLGKKAKKT